MSKHRIIVWPSNPASFFLWSLGLIFLLGSLYLLWSVIGQILTAPLYVLAITGLTSFSGCFASIFLVLVVVQRMILTEDAIDVITWKYGSPYKPGSNSMKWPKWVRTRIPYASIRTFGIFFAHELIELHSKSSEDSNQNPDDIKLILKPSQIRFLQNVITVLILIDDHQQVTLINVDLYSNNQLKWILYELQAATLIQPKGFLEPKRGNNAYLKNLLVFLAVLFIFIVLPISLVYLEAIMNPSHPLSYQSWLRTTYLISAMFGGISLSVVFAYLRSTSKEKSIFKTYYLLFLGFMIVSYLVSLISFILSVMS